MSTLFFSRRQRSTIVEGQIFFHRTSWKVRVPDCVLMGNEQQRDTDKYMYMWKIYPENNSNFLCVRSSLTHNVTFLLHMCCGLCIHMR